MRGEHQITGLKMAAAMQLCRFRGWRFMNFKSHFHPQPFASLPRSRIHSAAVLFVSTPVPNGIDQLDPFGKSYGPAVRVLLMLYNLEPKAIPASGPHGKLLKSDVINYITVNKLIPAISSVQPIESPFIRDFEKPKLVQSPKVLEAQKPKLVSKSKAAFEDIPNSSLRQSIAKRLTESKFNVPHSYSHAECNIDSLEKMVKIRKDDGSEVSTRDFIIKAVAVVLNRVPSVNVRWVNGEVTHVPQVDISVSIPTDMGLATKILEKADTIAVEDIAHKIKDVLSSNKDVQVIPDGNNSGAFTVLVHHEVYDIPYLTSIICPPQCAVLTVGTSKSTLNENGSWNCRLNLTLSYNRKAIEDTSACEFLHEIVSVLQNPSHGFIKSSFQYDLV